MPGCSDVGITACSRGRQGKQVSERALLICGALAWFPMQPDEEVELDARLAWVLNLGFRIPEVPATRADYVRMEAEVAELRARATDRGSIKVSCAEIARAVAELAGINVPSRPETMDLLATLVLDIQESGIMDGREVFIIGLLDDSGWPLDPEKNLMENVIAAADLGMFDPPKPSTPTEEQPGDLEPEPDAGTEPDAAEPRVVSVSLSIGGEVESAFADAERWRDAQPPPEPRRTVHEQFLFDWEFLLGSILDIIRGELFQNGYLDIGPG